MLNKKVIIIAMLAINVITTKVHCDSDPISAGLIWATASVGGGLVGAGAIMSYDQIQENRRMDNTPTNTRVENTQTTTRR